MKNEKTNIVKDDSSNRVIRGGSWFNNASGARVSFRFYNDPSGRYDDLGFRLVLQKKEKKKK
jgi:formylglycine-generating enzyme required for sulfatase activity